RTDPATTPGTLRPGTQYRYDPSQHRDAAKQEWTSGIGLAAASPPGRDRRYRIGGSTPAAAPVGECGQPLPSGSACGPAFHDQRPAVEHKAQCRCTSGLAACIARICGSARQCQNDPSTAALTDRTGGSCGRQKDAAALVSDTS